MNEIAENDKTKSICLIGGKLQGVEVAYLAKKAGLFVNLIDKVENPLGKFIVDEFFCFDITKNPEKLIEISKFADYIIPTNENEKAIETIERLKNEKLLESIVLFDFDSYKISSDKMLSKELFEKINVPMPKNNPENPPCFIKQRSGSGSIGAKIIDKKEDLKNYSEKEFIIEEYVKGPIVSLEIIGNGKDYKMYKETRIHIDENYDCSRVTPLNENKELREITKKIASELNLKGIMDIEAIESENGIKVMEIDARFPSQTPIAVFMSTGINFIEELISAFDNGFKVSNDNERECSEGEYNEREERECSGKEKNKNECSRSDFENKHKNRYGVFEHFLKNEIGIHSVGENAISEGDKLSFIYKNEENEEEIIECRRDDGYRAYTFIYSANDEKDASEKRNRLLKIIA